jgi:hypothetical protein
MNDELDVEIQQALRSVAVPAGAKEMLLLQLNCQLDEAVGACTLAETQPPVELSKVQPAKVADTLLRRHWGFIITGVAAAIVAIAAFTLVPSNQSGRLDVLLARQIERIENEPLTWQPLDKLPKSLQGVLGQVVKLQPLSFADITPPHSLSKIYVYAFRNQDGKQILLIDMPKPSVKQKIGSQLMPLNTNTGGWSCAVAQVDGSLVVLAVPGNRAYLLEHLRNVTVT